MDNVVEALWDLLDIQFKTKLSISFYLSLVTSSSSRNHIPGERK